jgi:hypothetical protein
LADGTGGCLVGHYLQNKRTLHKLKSLELENFKLQALKFIASGLSPHEKKTVEKRFVREYIGRDEKLITKEEKVYIC